MGGENVPNLEGYEKIERTTLTIIIVKSNFVKLEKRVIPV